MKNHDPLDRQVETGDRQVEIGDRQVEIGLRMENQILRQNAVLNGINKVFQEALVCESEEEVAKRCLAVAEELTESKFGFIGEINASGRFDATALSNPGWDACKMPKSDAAKLLKDMEIRGIWGSVLLAKRSLIVNNPASHPDSKGTPEGHPPIMTFLGVPLSEGRKTIGMIGLANRESGYDLGHQQDIEALSVAFTEVLHHKRTERELRKSEERFLQIAENAQEWIWEVDAEGLYTYSSPTGEKVHGYTSDEVVGKKHFFDFFRPEDREKLKKAAFEVFARKQSFREFPNRNVRKDGKTVWLLTSGVPLVDREGNLLGYRGADMDITELKRIEEERRNLEAQVQQVQKLESLGVLAGGIAHDFNNLLMGILGNADLALTDLSPVSPVRDNIKEIEIAARRAAELSRQMLAYSGKGRFVVEPIDLNSVVEEMTHLLDVGISKSAVLKYNLADNLPAVEADATQIRQIVMNLITNASDAIGKRSGIISISTGAMNCDRNYLNETFYKEKLPEGFYVYLEVADTGGGMDEETQVKIFDPFFTTKFTGRGLGLAAVLGIVRSHGGAIKVYSEPGKGTTFKVLFPASEKPAESIGSEFSGVEDWQVGGTVLLVDDEETVRSVGKSMLEKIGFRVLVASNGREAVGIFQEHSKEIVCVLLDLTMPHMDGEETFRNLGRIKKGVPVILSSGYNEQDVVNRFAGKGLAGFIQKPYQVASLAAKLREVLRE